MVASHHGTTKQKGLLMKKTKRAGVLTKIVILAILIVVSIALLNLRSQLSAAERTRSELQAQVDAQTQTNAALQENIDNSDDPDTVLEVAKERLGLVSKDEVIFNDTTN